METLINDAALDASTLKWRQVRDAVPGMPYATLTELRDTLTEQLLVAQDAAHDRTVLTGVVGITDRQEGEREAGDGAADLASDFVQPSQEERSVEDGPISISTLEDWLGEELHVRGSESYLQTLKRVGKRPDRTGWIARKLVREIPESRLIAGQEMDLYHGGDFAAWAAGQFQPTRVDEDYVAEAPLVLIESEDDPVEAEKVSSIRSILELVHSELAERLAEFHGCINADEWAALEEPQDYSEAERLMARHAPSAYVSRYSGTPYYVPAKHRVQRDPNSAVKPGHLNSVPWFPEPVPHRPDAGVVHELPEGWYFGLRKKQAKRHSPRRQPTQNEHRRAIQRLGEEAKRKLDEAHAEAVRLEDAIEDELNWLRKGQLKRDLERAEAAIVRNADRVVKLREAWARA